MGESQSWCHQQWVTSLWSDGCSFNTTTRMKNRKSIILSKSERRIHVRFDLVVPFNNLTWSEMWLKEDNKITTLVAVSKLTTRGWTFWHWMAKWRQKQNKQNRMKVSNYRRRFRITLSSATSIDVNNIRKKNMADEIVCINNSLNVFGKTFTMLKVIYLNMRLNVSQTQIHNVVSFNMLTKVNNHQFA
jgi:hypothetical protein